MYKILPQNFSSIATNIQEKDSLVSFNLKCTCDNCKFFLYKNKKNTVEKNIEKNWESLIKNFNGGYSDKYGNVYLTKSFMGFKLKQIKLEKNEIPNYIVKIKAICSKCGNEYEIFDNRYNGYDSMNENLSIDKANMISPSFSYKKINKEDCMIKIKIKNDLPYSEFIEEFPNATMENYLNCYSYISIYFLFQNKYKCIFSYETR